MEERKLPANTFEGPRKITYQSRVTIGFSERDTWRDAPAYFDEHSLTIQGHPVMQDWEKEYMERLADIASLGGGTVLEVGFGMGLSAKQIQWHAVSRHLIIEANRDVFQILEEFAACAEKPIVPIFGFWEDVITHVPSNSISGILFDTYPLTKEQIHANHLPFFEEAYRVLKPGGILTYYSDEIDAFSSQHLAALHSAGFKNIDYEICAVQPPEDCTYWRSPTLLVPIIRK